MLKQELVDLPTILANFDAEKALAALCDKITYLKDLPVPTEPLDAFKSSDLLKVSPQYIIEYTKRCVEWENALADEIGTCKALILFLEDSIDLQRHALLPPKEAGTEAERKRIAALSPTLVETTWILDHTKSRLYKLEAKRYQAQNWKNQAEKVWTYLEKERYSRR
jgi:hypothetical protein